MASGQLDLPKLIVQPTPRLLIPAPAVVLEHLQAGIRIRVCRWFPA